jgi:Predicted Zn-dependent protease (DUF2268)
MIAANRVVSTCSQTEGPSCEKNWDRELQIWLVKRCGSMSYRDLGVFALIVQLFFGLSRAVASESPEIIDLIPQDLQLVTNLSGDTDARAERFSKEILERQPEIYQHLWHVDSAKVKAFVARVPEYISGIRKLHALFEQQEPTILDHFCQAFPEFAPGKVKVYLMLSLFQFDAKIPSEHPDSLLIGIDGLARFHGTDVPLAVILSHEFFHLYHFQVNPLPKNPDDLPLYRLLWQEGLAVYASKQLNGGASLADVLLDPRLAANGPASVQAEAKRLMLCLDSREDITAAHFLAKSENGEGRIGYLIGYDVVTSLARNRSLSALARLRDPGLRFAFRREVYRLAYGRQ